ncbi:hypothetical protein HK405_012548 [Cladochytrium tenue]|nr:hypothetical protein HK405_012548 [Cladochytrium tenue]
MLSSFVARTLDHALDGVLARWTTTGGASTVSATNTESSAPARGREPQIHYDEEITAVDVLVVREQSAEASAHGTSGPTTIPRETERDALLTKIRLACLAAVFLATSLGVGFTRVAALPVLAIAGVLLNVRLAYGLPCKGMLDSVGRHIPLYATLVGGIAISLLETDSTEAAARPLTAGPDYVIGLFLFGAVLSAVVIIPAVSSTAVLERDDGSLWKNPQAKTRTTARLLIFPTLWAAAWRVAACESLPTGAWGNWGIVAAMGSGSLGDLVPVVAVGGQFILDFVLALLGQAVADACSGLQSFRFITGHVRPTHRTPPAISALTALGTLAIASAVGIAWTPSPTADALAPALSVACVLPPRDVGSSSAAAVVDALLRGTATAASRGARLVVWSEGAAQLETATDADSLLARTAAVAAGYGAYIAPAFTAPDPTRHNLRRNEVAVVAPVVGVPPLLRYTKSHLVFAAESHSYTPGNGSVPGAVASFTTINAPASVRDRDVEPILDGRNWEEMGNLSHVMKPAPTTFQVALAPGICHDLDYPSFGLRAAHAARTAAKAVGAINLPVILVSPARTWSAASGRAHVDVARVRAAEAGVAVVRCDADGQTAAIDAWGRLQYWRYSAPLPQPAAAAVAAGTPPRARVLNFDLLLSPPGRAPPMYARLGDAVAVIAFALAAACLVLPGMPAARTGVAKVASRALAALATFSDDRAGRVVSTEVPAAARETDPLLITATEAAVPRSVMAGVAAASGGPAACGPEVDSCSEYGDAHS